MSNIRHLNTAIDILTAPKRVVTEDLSGRYKTGLAALGWFRCRRYKGRDVFANYAAPGVTYEVGRGDDVRRSKDGGEALPIPPRAKRMILLAGQ